MKLMDYLRREEQTFTAFALKIGSRHARTVERYAKGQTIPNTTMMGRIVEVTGGEVMPNDFFDTSRTILSKHADSANGDQPGKADRNAADHSTPATGALA